VLGVFLLFIDPIGAGIPAGVLLAKHRGIGWFAVSFLYFLSDCLMACVFEPLMRMAGRWAAGKPKLAKFAEAYRAQLQKTAEQYGKATGPVALTLVAFGVDPMTARTAAAAAGYGFVSGWAFAILGDMFYFWLVAYSTLKLNKWLGGDPSGTIALMLLAMMFLPSLVKKLRARIAGEPVPVPIEPRFPR
jgi:hypothetical protein